MQKKDSLNKNERDKKEAFIKELKFVVQQNLREKESIRLDHESTLIDYGGKD